MSYIGLLPTAAPGGGTGTTVTVVDDNATNSTRYPTFSASNTGTADTIYTSSTKYSYNPSTGELSATSFNTTSDMNAKTNIVPLVGALDTVCVLTGYSFNYLDSGKESTGVIAQEVLTAIPSAVSINAEGMYSVNYSAIIPYLIESIKTLREEIQLLKK